MKHRYLVIITMAILFSFLFYSCAGSPSAGQMLMDVEGETFPFKKPGLFSKNHDFWVYGIRKVDRTGRQKTTIGVKDTEVQTTSRGLGFLLEDPAGYEWSIVSLAELKEGRRPDMKGMTVVSYTFSARMDEKSTGVARRIRAEYVPAASGFDGTLRGTVSSDSNEVIYTFESNVRLDVHEKPDDGFQLFSIASPSGTTVAILDSRDGYEVTFFEGLVPTQRTQLAGTISSLFMLMKYGVL